MIIIFYGKNSDSFFFSSLNLDCLQSQRLSFGTLLADVHVDGKSSLKSCDFVWLKYSRILYFINELTSFHYYLVLIGVNTPLVNRIATSLSLLADRFSKMDCFKEPKLLDHQVTQDSNETSLEYMAVKIHFEPETF